MVECANGGLPWDYLVRTTRMQADAQKDAGRPVYDHALKPMEARDLFKSKALDFAHVLLLSRTFKATDTRDRVYDLLGLNTEFAAVIGRPDYNKSMEEVFMDTTRTFPSGLLSPSNALCNRVLASQVTPLLVY
ncbi:hypothetical protein K469DRAFT_809308 [Zopfia rhizophila CBS 207.26]|uniref:Uncharacterized protein n=1 Tax=Zopfia rhizophila CBS 207.26 TaxID=1314779 RepID=A0A6A6DCV5_9PEZI|nr:hypothetical protein K469DRAFT_809308 [Zopfia rhizophila CBS 207.26]